MDFLLPFDPTADLTDKIRARIQAWQRYPPNSQFQQYSPVNKYLHERFIEALVKPQALVRPRLDEQNTALLQSQLQGDGVPDGQIEQAEALQDADSTTGFVLNGRDNGKKYPDFHVCKYSGAVGYEGADLDIVRIVIEIASVPRTGSIQQAKKKVEVQLLKSMNDLKDDGDGRCSEKKLGAMLGTEAAFVKPADPNSFDPRQFRPNGNQPVSIYSEQWAGNGCLQ